MDAKIKTLLWFTMILFSFGLGKAQAYELLPKKGVITLNKKNCQNNGIVKLNKDDVIWVSPGALALVRAAGGIAKQLAAGKTYKYGDIAKMFPRKKSFNTAIFDFIFGPVKAFQQEGGASRGPCDSAIVTSPIIGKIILADSLNVFAKMILAKKPEDCKINGNSHFYIEGETDTTHINIFYAKNRYIPCPKPGVYKWFFSAQVGGSAEFDAFEYSFTVPSKEEKTKYLEEWNNFKNAISNFSSEMRTILEDEYLQVNRLYLKP
jgi:hypothetical protein